MQSRPVSDARAPSDQPDMGVKFTSLAFPLGIIGFSLATTRRQEATVGHGAVILVYSLAMFWAMRNYSTQGYFDPSVLRILKRYSAVVWPLCMGLICLAAYGNYLSTVVLSPVVLGVTLWAWRRALLQIRSEATTRSEL